jgi:hypothetical protein
MIPSLLSLLLAVSPGVSDGGVVVAKGHKFLAEVARTPQEQAKGLMYRQALAKDRCMIFIYPEPGYHSIWMRNCLISLDVVWLSENGTVVELQRDAPPCSPMLGDGCPTYGGVVESWHFVEFSKGTIDHLGLKKGDRLGWNLTFSDGGGAVGGLPVPADSPKGHSPKK